MIITEDYHVTLYDKERVKIRSLGSEELPMGGVCCPYGVMVTADSHVLVANYNNKCVQKLTMTGELVASVSSHPSGFPWFSEPCGLALDPSSGKIFVTDVDKCNVQVLNPDLTFSHMFGSEGCAQGQFNCPFDIAVNSRGMVYVADTCNNRVQKFAAAGEFVMAVGGHGSRPGELDWPTSLAIDRMDNVYVGESGNKRVSVFTCNGEFLYCFGEGKFSNPWGLALDDSEHLLFVILRTSVWSYTSGTTMNYTGHILQ